MPPFTTIKREISAWCRLVLSGELKLAYRMVANVSSAGRGRLFARALREGIEVPGPAVTSPNSLVTFFEDTVTGPGIWKWTHYFEIYDRHLAKFVGKRLDLAEVGVYSGGSLPMWLDYFGAGCHVVGVDIEPACTLYETDRIDIVIGDQASRTFWERFRQKVPHVDVFIDDGGHTPEQQMVTLEEMLGHLRPGGVYICEDVHGIGNRFAAFASGLVDELNSFAVIDGEGLASAVTPAQRRIHSIHFYPYMLVIELHHRPVTVLRTEKRGSEWQPFYLDEREPSPD